MGAVFDIQAKSNRNDISKRNKKVAVRNKFNTRQASKTYTEKRERETKKLLEEYERENGSRERNRTLTHETKQWK